MSFPSPRRAPDNRQRRRSGDAPPMTPTTSRPRALLRAAVAALGLWLAVLAVLNLFIVGRAATDENLFIDPLSHLYVVEEVEGRPGTSRVFEPQAAFVPRQADAADAIAP